MCQILDTSGRLPAECPAILIYIRCSLTKKSFLDARLASAFGLGQQLVGFNIRHNAQISFHIQDQGDERGLHLGHFLPGIAHNLESVPDRFGKLPLRH